MKKILFTLILFLLPLPLLAQEAFPSFPMAFYGNANLNSTGLPAGTIIQAYNNDQLLGEVILIEAGIYGYDNPTKIRLIIKEYTIGDVIFKYILPSTSEASTGNNILKYTAGYISGETIKLDLNFTKQSLPTSPSPGGGWRRAGR